jgi:hypothetical protein
MFKRSATAWLSDRFDLKSIDNQYIPQSAIVKVVRFDSVILLTVEKY